MQEQTQVETEDNQLDREYSKSEFVQILEDLSNGLSLSRDYDYFIIFDQIHDKKSQVTGRDIVQVIEQIKQEHQNNVQLARQLSYYSQKINKLKLKDIHSLKKSDFQKYFVEQNNVKGNITTLITQKIQNLDYISIKKLQALVDILQKMREQKKQVVYPSAINMNKSSIFVGDEEGDAVQGMINYVHSTVKDPFILQELQKYCMRITNNERQDAMTIKDKQLTQDSLRKEINRQQEYIIETDRLISQKDEYINRLQKKNQKAIQQLNDANRSKKQTVLQLQKLQLQNDELFKQRNMANAKCKDIEQELDWFRSNYKELTQQYTKAVETIRDVQKKNEQENNERFFTQRSLKQQLEDAHAKINRLREQKNKLKQTLTQAQSKYEARIAQLQLDLQQAYQHHNRDSAIKAMRVSRQSMAASYVQRYDQSVVPSTVHRSKLPVQQDNPKMSVQMKESSLAIHREVENRMSQAFKKKKAFISEKVQQLLIDGTEQTINEFDEIGILQQKELTQLVNRVEEGRSSKLGSSKVKGQLCSFYSATALIIHDSGDKFPKGIIVINDKILILDTKNRYEFEITFEMLTKIYICYHNLSWIVLKLKKSVQEKSSNHKDMVLQLNNREQLLQFIMGNCMQKINQHKINLKVQKEDNIWLNVHGKSLLLSNYKNYYNIYRISVHNCRNIFDILLKDNSLLSFEYECVLAICSLGIMVFEKDGENDIQKKQNLLYFLPLVQKMQVIQLKNSKDYELKITYEHNKKTYKIKGRSCALTKRLKKKIEMERENNLRMKRQQFQKYDRVLSSSSIK